MLAIPALVGIFFLGQAILDARAVRLDLTPERRYTLSDHARKILDGLPADVRVIAFLRAQDPRNLLIRDLLRQVALRSPRVHVDILDVNRSPPWHASTASTRTARSSSRAMDDAGCSRTHERRCCSPRFSR